MSQLLPNTPIIPEQIKAVCTELGYTFKEDQFKDSKQMMLFDAIFQGHSLHIQVEYQEDQDHIIILVSGLAFVPVTNLATLYETAGLINPELSMCHLIFSPIPTSPSSYTFGMKTGCFAPDGILDKKALKALIKNTVSIALIYKSMIKAMLQPGADPKTAMVEFKRSHPRIFGIRPDAKSTEVTCNTVH